MVADGGSAGSGVRTRTHTPGACAVLCRVIACQGASPARPPQDAAASGSGPSSGSHVAEGLRACGEGVGQAPPSRRVSHPAPRPCSGRGLGGWKVFADFTDGKAWLGLLSE